MNPRRISEIVPGILERATRIAALCQFVNTFDDAGDRIEVVSRLYAGGIVTSQTADLIIENLNLEVAS